MEVILVIILGVSVLKITFIITFRMYLRRNHYYGNFLIILQKRNHRYPRRTLLC